MYLLTESEDRSGKQTKHNEVRMTESQIFSCPARPNSVHRNFILTKQTSVATK